MTNGQTQTPPPQQEQPVNEADKQDIEKNKMMAVLAYLGILVLVPLLAAKDSKFAKFHAKQGLILLIAWVISSVLAFAFVGFILYVVCVVFSIWGIVNAATGKYADLPLVGNLAKKFKF